MRKFAFVLSLVVLTIGQGACKDNRVELTAKSVQPVKFGPDLYYVVHDSTRPVTVYIFDGGISPAHPELAGRVRLGFTAYKDDPKICNAHGTAVAGAIGGTEHGVAPEAELVDVKIIACEKLRGSVAAIDSAVAWVIADHKMHPGPAVANWSFAVDSSHGVPEVDSAARRLLEENIPVVVAAGNFNVDACHVSPANSPGVIVVGSIVFAKVIYPTENLKLVNKRSDHSAFGNCISLYAPGDSVRLPDLDTHGNPTVNTWNGTSMAAGYVSGVVAQIKEKYPGATTEQVKMFLIDSSSLWTPILGVTEADKKVLNVPKLFKPNP